MQANSSKHPKALPYLFFTEMWERFGYYLILGIFVLYLTDVDKGGFGFDRATASDIYGTFIAFVYLTPFIGGYLADFKLGYIKAIFIGGALMGLGYMGLAFHEKWIFYTSLGLICVGNGFFKPNISALLGKLYDNPDYKANKDTGYNLFYMGINIGAFICNFFAAYLRNSIGWGAAFMAAGIGMFLGLIVFAIGLKYYNYSEIKETEQAQKKSEFGKVVSQVLLPALVAGSIGWLLPGNYFGSDSTDAFLLAAIPVCAFYYRLYKESVGEDRKLIGALLSIFAVSIIFWAVFKQNGTALTTWAQYYTDRKVPATAEPFLKTIKLVEEDVYAMDSVTAYNEKYQVIKGEDSKPLKVVDIPVYFKNIPKEQLPAEGTKWSLLNTEIFQSINPFFVIILTPLLVLFFAGMRRRKSEPGTPTKMAWGLFISGCSTLVMVAACYWSINGSMKVSPWWLMGTYGVITIGELLLSPMGLSLVSKISPKPLTGLMMGGWFLATSLGNKLSGILSTLWDKYDDKANFFWVNFVLLMIATGIMLSLLKRSNSLFKEM